MMFYYLCHGIKETMWNKPYKYKEGVVIGLLVSAVGVLLQFTVGGIDWDVFTWPVNIIVLSAYVLLLLVGYLLRRKIYLVEWTMTLWSAIPSMLFSAAYTLWFGITSWTEMLSFWPFVLTYLWMMNCIGLISIQRLVRLFFTKGSIRTKLMRDVPFLFNHLGLFIAMIAGTLGNADLVKTYVTATVGEEPTWRPPFAIELHNFTIEEYPAQIIVIDNETGARIEESEWVVAADTLFDDAAFVTCRNTLTDQTESGWVSNGYYDIPYQFVRLDDRCSVVMPEREPKKYASEVTVHCESGKTVDAVIEVNKPLKVDGWKIYQYGYDESMGRWSTTSVFQLVHDPWLPYVYLGIYMMLLGALCLFLLPRNN